MGVADRPGLACVALLVRAGVAGSAAGACIRPLFNRAFLFLISSSFAAILTEYASAIAALLSACASAIEADAAVSLVAFNLEKYLDGMLSSWSLETSGYRFLFFAGGDINGEEEPLFKDTFTATNGNINNIKNYKSTICGCT